MGSDENDDSKKNSQSERDTLRERIQNLEWALAQKNRENKSLKAEIESCKEENSNLQHEVSQLNGENDDQNQSG